MIKRAESVAVVTADQVRQHAMKQSASEEPVLASIRRIDSIGRQFV